MYSLFLRRLLTKNVFRILDSSIPYIWRLCIWRSKMVSIMIMRLRYHGVKMHSCSHS